jgi:hypothetical protein
VRLVNAVRVSLMYSSMHALFTVLMLTVDDSDSVGRDDDDDDDDVWLVASCLLFMIVLSVTPKW